MEYRISLIVELTFEDEKRQADAIREATVRHSADPSLHLVPH